MIHLYLKIPENFVHLILQDGFWVMYIPFVCMVKLKLLTQFQAYHLAHPVVSSLILFLRVFHVANVFYLSLSDSKSPEVSRTLLSVLANLNNAEVCMVSTRPLISKSGSPFIDPLVTVLRAPIKIGINVTFMFRSFFISLVRSKYLSFFSLSFNFTLWSTGQQSPQFCKFYYYYYYLFIGFSHQP